MIYQKKNPAAVVSEGVTKSLCLDNISRNHTPQEKSYRAINALAVAVALPILWYPHAKRHGQSLRLGNVQGDAGGSLWICLKTGAWKDHATGESGGDLVSLYAVRHNVGQSEAKRAIIDMLGGKVNYTPKPPLEDKTKVQNTQRAQRIWNESVSAQNTAVEAYLRGRGICTMPESIKHHPAALHAPSACNYPAMIAGTTRWPDNKPHAIHRTYLHGDKKAAIKPNKMMLGSINGGAVRLGNVSNVIIVTEGIETGLSVQQATGIPTWAVLSTSNYNDLILPDTVEEIIIAADHDDAGIRAAENAARLWSLKGLTVRIIMPPAQKTDFNDLILGVS